MKTRKKKTTEKISGCEIEDILQRAYLHFTPDDFVTIEDEDTQELDTGKDDSNDNAHG